ERLHERLGKRETGGLDDDVVDFGAARENGVECRDELVRHGAAEAAIGELNDVLLRARGIPAALEDLAIDSHVTELVDDHGEAAATGIRQDMADQRRLAGAEKAGDDGAGHARERGVHALSSSKSVGGTRAIRPRLRASGRPRHGRMPSAAPASRRAPSISAGAQSSPRPPKM